MSDNKKIELDADFFKQMDALVGDDPAKQAIAKVITARYQQLHGSGDKISSTTYKFYNKITLSVKVGVPDDMSIGELKTVLEKIEKQINENYKITFNIEFSNETPAV